MPTPVIKVESLSKRYRIGLKEKRRDTLLGQIGSALRAPLDNFRQLRSLSRFNEDDESVFWALRDINFEVQQGEVLGIIGHNGAGKSTLLKILSRITEPTDGRITVTGRIGALLEVGTGFHPELTGRDNIYMNGTILGMTRREIDRKLDEIVDFSGVEKYIDTPVKFYSSGMKVRLGFAVAAHLEPEILVIDEVLAVGDAEFQRKCLGKMKEVSGEGRTVLFVSHNMAAVRSLCQRVVVLDKGNILTDRATNEAISLYLEKLQGGHTSTHYITDNKDHYSAKILEIYLEQDHLQLDHPLDLSKETLIKIKYANNISGQCLNLSLSIFDEETNYILSSPSLTDDKFFNQPHPIGIFETSCALPKFLFNDKNYKITIMLVRNTSEIVEQLDEIIQLNFIDGEKSRLNYYGKWNGLIRPILNWDTAQIQ